MNFASLCFASKQKLLNRSEGKNFNRNKWEKNEKNEKNKNKSEKKQKKWKNILEFRFDLFPFEVNNFCICLFHKQVPKKHIY